LTAIKARRVFAVLASVPPGEHETMAVKLNNSAFDHARHLIAEGKFIADKRDDRSDHQPSAATRTSSSDCAATPSSAVASWDR
jgi:hypothetical protein